MRAEEAAQGQSLLHANRTALPILRDSFGNLTWRRRDSDQADTPQGDFASSGKLEIWEILQETLVGGVHRFFIPLGCYLLAWTLC